MNILVPKLEKMYTKRRKTLPGFLLTIAIIGLSHTLSAQFGISYQFQADVYLDTLENCSFDAGEPLISDVIVAMEIEPSGAHIYGFASIGIASIIANIPPGDTLVRIYISGFNNFNAGCQTVYEFPVSGDTSASFHLTIPLRAGTCSQMGIDISGTPPRPCFDRSYFVSTFNKGLTTAEDVYVDVTLDPDILFQSSSLTGLAMGNNVWRFPLGDVSPLNNKNFSITYQLDCDVPPGQVICSEAAIYPDTFCMPNAGWNGAKVYAQATCAGDSVKFTLSNLGNVPTSPNLDYIIAEDLIMYLQDEFQLGPNESMNFSVPANGATWHISADQEPGYPGSYYTNATIEGCGLPGDTSSTGIFLNYPFTPGLFNHATDCQEAVSSFDPNDKQGFPKGYGTAHYIRTNDEIKYQIRFQNTGTDTAYTVVVREPLPAGLDPASLIPGASSHPYTFTINQNGEMAFTFKDIDLPDSTTNLPASNGFLSYRARPLANLPGGTIISGAAEIYFDFNPPIVTNTVFHTIEEDFITVQTNKAPDNKMQMNVFPNPATRFVHFEWKNANGRPWQVKLFDALGRPVNTIDSNGDTAFLPCNTLPIGLYFFRVSLDNQVIKTGRIIIQ